MNLDDAISTYHDLLSDDMAELSQEMMVNQMERRGLYFGDRPLCTVLRPRFLTANQYNFLRQRIRLLMRAFDKSYRVAISHQPVLDQYGLLDWEKELIQIDPGYLGAAPLSRLDAFFLTSTDELRFTEYNAEVPAAPAYNDALTDVFFTLPVVRKFARRYEMRPLPVRQNVMHTLWETYYHWAGRREIPKLAIIDWREVPTYSEFLLFQKYFAEQGIDCPIFDPRNLEYKNGKLMAGDYHITLIYKRVLIDELVTRMGLENPIVQAVRDGAVCMVNPFRCKILYKKASLAVLSDERNDQYFSAEESAAIRAHIPWTRMVEERHTKFDGVPVDLVPFILKYKDRFVLKPNDDYGGHGITLGWTVDEQEWERAVEVALELPHVVQDRIYLPREPYPSMINGRLNISDRMLDTAPFVFHGSYVDGCLTRLGTADLLNVTAGGGSTVPTFVVDERY
jgi:hypothetical protein